MIDHFISRNAKFFVIFILALLLLLVSGYSYYKTIFESKQLVAIATGEPSSESYKIMNAIADIVNNEEYDFRIKVISTQGSIENLYLLDKNLVQMATLQADLKINNNVKLVANLYEDVFHLIFRPYAYLKNVEDINGLKIAVSSKNSGESYSFKKLVEHFGLDESKLRPVESTWKSATWLFNNGDIDGIFKVREANHVAIKKIMINSDGQSREITQSDAIALNHPMYHKTIIPRGIFGGIPPNPKADVTTIGVNRLLVTTDKVSPDIVNVIAAILFTRKRELAEKSNVAGLVSIPEATSLIPLHQGLIDFVNKEKPSFLQKNSEFLALILSIIILMGSSILQFLNRSKQQRLNAYNEKLLSIKVNVEQTNNLSDLAHLREEHYALVNQIVGDAVNGKISSNGFEFFTFGWDSVTSLINDKEQVLGNE